MSRRSILAKLILLIPFIVSDAGAQSGVSVNGTAPSFSDSTNALEMLKGEATVDVHVTDSSGRLLDVQASIRLFPAQTLGNRVNSANVAGSEQVSTVKHGL